MICADESHERRRVGIDVVRAGGVEVRVARRADMHHRRDIVLHHLLVDGVPPFVGERRVGPFAARGIGVEIDADEAEILHQPVDFGQAVLRRLSRHLRQLTDADELVGIKVADAFDRVVADLGPVPVGGLTADMMCHGRRARRKNGQVGAALTLQLELRTLDALAQLIIAHLQPCLRRQF
jgi:hypothetical protein